MDHNSRIVRFVIVVVREPHDANPSSGVRIAADIVLTGTPNTRSLELSIGNDPVTLPVMNAPGTMDVAFTRKFVIRI